MGNFYVSFAVRVADPAVVAATLGKHGRSAFVSPEQGGIVHFYDEKSDEQDVLIIEELGALASGEMATTVLAVLNHDDDVLQYWLFENGELTDTYNSFPGYFGSEDDDQDDGVLPQGGDAAKLVRALGAKTSAKKVHDVLRADNEREDYVFAVDRHSELANLLGLQGGYACLGFGYVRDGTAEDIPDRDRFLEVK